MSESHVGGGGSGAKVRTGQSRWLSDMESPLEDEFNQIPLVEVTLHDSTINLKVHESAV